MDSGAIPLVTTDRSNTRLILNVSCPEPLIVPGGWGAVPAGIPKIALKRVKSALNSAEEYYKQLK
jgi:hypothetical protein